MNLEEKIVRYRVFVGIIILIAVLIFSKPTVKSVFWGAMIGFIGILIRAWASGHINKNNELTVSGPYRFTRNPLYLGNIIITIGLMINSNSIISFSLLSVYLLIFYPFLIIREKKYLKNRFVDDYKMFESVPLLIPNPFKKTEIKNKNNKFSFQRYLNNREYNAFFGFIIIMILFLLRIYLKKYIGW